VFNDIPPSIAARMAELEAVDARDRVDGTARRERLRQIPPQTGRFVALLVAIAPPGRVIEIGTSAGYSTLWIALACRELGRTVTTFEVLAAKAALARETFAGAGVEDVVELVHGDARDYLPDSSGVAFCFLDAEKDVYEACYELVVPAMVPGGLLVADNALNFADELQPMLDRAQADERVDAMVVPIDRGELVCRKR
jgi:caffeoyl-CoA O-methyltransferase